MKWRAGLYKTVIGNNGYAGATRCQVLSDFAQVSDHGFQAFQTGQLLRAEAPGIVPDRIECGEVQRRRAWKRSEEHTSELQSHVNLVCRLLLEKKKKNIPKVSMCKNNTITQKH